MSPRYAAALAALLAAAVASAEPLAGTAPLTAEGDLASQMVEGIDRFLLRQTAEAAAGRRPPDPVDAARQKLAKMIGVVDGEGQAPDVQIVSRPGQPQAVARAAGFEVFEVRWPVHFGVDGEGLLLVPTGRETVADVVAVPDADQTPEMLIGNPAGGSPVARRLAESGCRVLVPFLVNRADTFSVSRGGRETNQPAREWVYRPAFEVGRHVIGYEVQKVRSAGLWLRGGDGARRRVGVIGYGEGGLVAMYAAALGSRFDAACVSGYFGPREDLWQEPIYRNVFGLLNHFGDAELAALAAPAALVVEACRAPEVAGPPEPIRGQRHGAAPGRIATPPLDSVRREFARAEAMPVAPGPRPRMELVVSGDGFGPFGTDAALGSFLAALSGGAKLAPAGEAPVELRALDLGASPELARARRQIEQLSEHTQRVVRESEFTRRKFWEKADAARAAGSPEQWAGATKWYRDYFENEVIGRFDAPLLAPNVRTRRVYDEPEYVGYEVVMDVFPDVFACGVLLVPKDIRPGERRPVVVCQHGLEGRPRDVSDPTVHNPSYGQFACRLAERGFVTYAPQNPYIFGDRFRALQRKANPLGKTLFSVIVPQHRQATEWLASLPFVDPERIAFYGLSYGGKTAMRVPPLVDRYCLSVCSADFNEWVWKNTSLSHPHSYVHNVEYEIFEWDLANTFNYAEMAALICPRPFMVERGHRDGVAPDEWVAYEYAKVRLLYADLKIPGRTRIEFFDGPHTIHGVGTFAFLHEQLKWPPPRQ